MITPKGIIHGITCSPHFMAVLDCALDVPADLRRTEAHFTGKATVTSDGYVMANFVDSDGRQHLGAFVCSWDNLVDNARGLDDHIRAKLVADWGSHAQDAISRWVGKDWRH